MNIRQMRKNALWKAAAYTYTGPLVVIIFGACIGMLGLYAACFMAFMLFFLLLPAAELIEKGEIRKGLSSMDAM